MRKPRVKSRRRRIAGLTTFKYFPDRLLGSGGFGDVYVCERDDGALFAMKRLSLVDEGSVARFAKEVRIIRGR